MKIIIVIITIIFFSTNIFAKKYQTKIIASELTYDEAVQYCLEDGDNWWIPRIKLLKKIISLGGLDYLDRWFWSSTKTSDELCNKKTCYYQVHSKTLLSRIRNKNESGHALCVSF